MAKKSSRRGEPVNVIADQKVSVEETFPAIAKWVQHGHIEIGDQDGFGFIVRALDYGGLAFEDAKSKTFSEAMLSLEKGLARILREEGIG